jgi:nanoRNase/pAp phosphatase (c-di-AMP/oligoRNAs hydrolase)
VADLIKDAKAIAVAVVSDANCDVFGAGVGIFDMLRSAGKNVQFLFTRAIPEGCSDLISDADIHSSIFDRELVVKIDYSQTIAEKAHYAPDPDNNVLTISLGPVPKNFDLTKVKAEITGFDFDLAFVLGAKALTDLAEVYEGYKDEFDTAKIVNIDSSKENTRFGIINIVDEKITSLSLLVLKKANLWNLPVDKNSARALLTGITQT